MSGDLPPGITISLDPTSLAGIPTTAGTYNFRVQASDGNFSDQEDFVLEILPGFEITTPSPLPNGTINAPYSVALSVSGSVGPVGWSLGFGSSLPPGLFLSPTGGQITGTPTTTGVFNFEVDAFDPMQDEATSKTFELRIVSALAITTNSPLPSGSQGVGYLAALTTSGAVGPVAWAITSGALPPGITLSPATGTLSGTPTVANTFNFTVQATDRLTSVTKPFQLVVTPPTLSITTTSLLAGTVGAAYSANVTAAGGVLPYTFTVTTGDLPTSLTLSTAGLISGTPTAAGTFNFTIQVRDSLNNTATRALSISIGAALTITTTPPLPEGVVGVVYSLTFTATGGAPPYSFAFAGGSLPGGLTLNAAGNLSGTPTVDGSFPFSVRVTDSVAATHTAAFTLIIRPVLTITSTSLPNATVQTPYTVTLTGQGGLMPYQWSTPASTLPPGLSFNASTATLSGTPTATGAYPIEFFLTDSTNRTVSRTLTLTVISNIRILTSAIPTITAGQPFHLEFAAEGGNPPYRWRLLEGILPQGLGFTSAGVLEGTAAGEARNMLNIQVSDQLSATSRVYNLTVLPAPLNVSSAILPAATVGRPYNFALQANGGTPPYQWDLAAGALPQGIQLGADGTLSGTPSAAGTFDFEVSLTDSSAFLSEAGKAAAASEEKAARQSFPFRLVVNVPPLEITTTSPLPEAAVATQYSVQLTATGGRTPYFWVVTAGMLPTGLTLNENTGQLTGTPTAAGTATFTVQARDNVGPVALRQFTLNVLAEADLLLSTYNVTFRVPLGRTSVTPQTVSVISRRNASVDYSVTADQPAPWLTVTSAAQSSTPSRFFLDVDPAGLAAGTYRTELRVVSTSSQQVIPLTVNLSVEAVGVILEASPNFGSGTETIQIRNIGGGGPASFTASVLAGAQWLTVSPPSGTIQPDGSLPILTTVNPGNLQTEFYRGVVRVTSGETFTDIPVLFDNTVRSFRFALVPEGDRLVARQSNGAARPARSFLIRNDGSLPVVWSGSVEAGGAWLSLSRTSGSVNPGESAPVDYRVDAANLEAGNYYGRIRITAAGGPPQDFIVVVQVLPASNAPEPEVAPNSLLFIASEGGAPPAAQTVQLYTSSTAPVSFQASGYTSDLSGWLVFDPHTGTVSTASPAAIRVSPVITGLKRGVYEGRIHFALSTTVVRDVPVVLIVTPPAVRAASSDRTAEGCTASRLVALHSGIPGNFAASAGWAIPVAVRLYDDCGERIPGGSLVLRFSNGDPSLPLRLTDPSTATYAATWVPGRSAPQLTITADASAPPLPGASVELVGSVQANSVPAVDRTGILHQFDPQPGGPLAPGTIIQIFGSDLARLTAAAEPPLPTTLNGVTVIIAGGAVPLSFVSPTQVNAQLPFGLSPGTPYQVVIGAGNAIVPPTSIRINDVQPGIASNPDGSVIALHANGDAITADSPAQPGEAISVFLGGLGRTEPAVPAGEASPLDPPSIVQTPVAASIDGAGAEVLSAKLAPGLVGVYEVRIAIPADITPGNKTLVLAQNDREANRTTLAVGAP